MLNLLITGYLLGVVIAFCMILISGYITRQDVTLDQIFYSFWSWVFVIFISIMWTDNFVSTHFHPYNIVVFNFRNRK